MKYIYLLVALLLSVQYVSALELKDYFTDYPERKTNLPTDWVNLTCETAECTQKEALETCSTILIDGQLTPGAVTKYDANDQTNCPVEERIAMIELWVNFKSQNIDMTAVPPTQSEAWLSEYMPEVEKSDRCETVTVNGVNPNFAYKVRRSNLQETTVVKLINAASNEDLFNFFMDCEIRSACAIH